MSPANSRKHTLPARRGLIPCSKKRRPSSDGVPDAAVVDGSELLCWATLDGDVLCLIAWRVLAGDFADYIRLRAVCSHWRSSTVCLRGRSVVDQRFHPRHWMMLPEGYQLYPGHTKLHGRVRFFNLRTGSIASVRLPLFRDHFAIDSVNGLLVLQRDHDMAVRILHPFTSDIVELPSLATLLPQLTTLFNRACLVRIILPVVSFSPNGDIKALVVLAYHHRVAFTSSEDQQWTLSSWECNGMRSLLSSSQGKLYFTDYHEQIFMVDPGEQERGKGSPPAPPSLPPPKLIATWPSDKIISSVRLGECDSEILLVGYTDHRFLQIGIYRLAEAILGRFVSLKSIGENSLFLGDRSLCMSPKAHPSIVSDSVVMKNQSVSKHLVQYHLKSSTWSTAADGMIHDGCIPSPYTFIHHVYTCCHPYYWNKGQIYNPASKRKWGVKDKWRLGA